MPDYFDRFRVSTEFPLPVYDLGSSRCYFSREDFVGRTLWQSCHIRAPYKRPCRSSLPHLRCNIAPKVLNSSHAGESSSILANIHGSSAQLRLDARVLVFVETPYGKLGKLNTETLEAARIRSVLPELGITKSIRSYFAIRVRIKNKHPLIDLMDPKSTVSLRYRSEVSTRTLPTLTEVRMISSDEFDYHGRSLDLLRST